MSLSPSYNPKQYESEIYQRWMAAGVGSPEVQEQVQTGGSIVSKLNKTYTILMPPPNLTGELHAGHAFQHYLMDTLSRIYRQKGYKTLWYPGVDHAGIQMEGVLVKLLKEQGKSRSDLSDEEFVEFAWQKANEWRNRQREQAAILGDTPDYNRQLFTLDERATKMVNYAFKQYWKDGLIYKGPYLVNWSVGLQTALSDVAGEIEYETRVDPLVTFEYRCKSLEIINHESELAWKLFEYLSENPLLVATVRPETIFGDVAVAIHPQVLAKKLATYNFSATEIQECIWHLKQNHWLFWYEIEPLGVKDVRLLVVEEVDPNFGTGVLKITPGSDLHDYEIFQKYLGGGKFPQAIGRDGRLTKVCGRFAGLTVLEARVEVIKTLLEAGYIPKKTSS